MTSLLVIAKLSYVIAECLSTRHLILLHSSGRICVYVCMYIIIICLSHLFFPTILLNTLVMAGSIASCVDSLSVAHPSPAMPRKKLFSLGWLASGHLLFVWTHIHIYKCDQIWENPAYCQNAHMAQCVFLAATVKKISKSSFCHIYVKEPFYTAYRG